MPTFAGKKLVVNERHRTYVISGLGVDWADAGYGVSLQITSPTGAVTYVTCLAVTGEPEQVQIGIDSVIYALDGSHGLRLIAHLGDPSDVDDWALATEIFNVNVSA